jgi:hypothetical protein
MEFRLRYLLGSLFPTFLVLIRPSFAACFLPDGSDRNAAAGTQAGDYLPCDATAEVSMCCAIGREGNVDICLPGGLCRSKESGIFWRESCTDQAWNSSACVKLFVDGAGW